MKKFPPTLVKILRITISAFLTTASLTAARSTPITYTITGVGSGTLGGRNFSGSLYTITGVADTSFVHQTGAFSYSVMNSYTTVSIAGIGTATFLDSFDTFYTSMGQNGFITGPEFGFGDLAPTGKSPSGSLFLEMQTGIFGSYNLGSPTAPIPGTVADFEQNDLFSTSDGNFDFSSVTSATFEAFVPETMHTLTLLSVAFVGLVIFQCQSKTTLEAGRSKTT